MIPLWKLRREWDRFRQQLSTIPEAIWEPSARRRHDNAFAAGFDTRQGAVPLWPDVAVILIYQPDDIPSSLIEMCRYLIANGFAPLIVSNAPLSDAALAILAPVSWQVMQRPNFGYDFGGYRDGLRHLWGQGVTLRSLLILNDSVWWPLREDDQFLKRLRALDADIAGTVLRDRAGERFLESYFYLIKGHLFAAADFREFWENFAITSNKYKVIRRGERGFSRAMIAAGYNVRGMFSQSGFLTLMASKPPEFLRKTLAFAAYQEAQDAKRGAELIERPVDDEWKADCLAHMAQTLVKGQSYSAFSYASLREEGYPVLKKSNDRISRHWRRSVLQAIDAGEIDAFSPSVMAELRAKQTQDAKDR